MYEFLGISMGLLLLALANDIGAPDPVMKTDFVSKPLFIVALR
jgi:hypothetical protein